MSADKTIGKLLLWCPNPWEEMHRSGYFHVLGTGCSLVLQKDLEYWTIGETRETREGWPMLTVETEVNGDSKSTKKKVLPWTVRWVCCAGTRDFCPALACSGQPSTNNFFPRCTLFQFMCPHRQATWASSRTGPPVYECVSPGESLRGPSYIVKCVFFSQYIVLKCWLLS